jgi:peptide/nickel transport system permease protein
LNRGVLNRSWRALSRFCRRSPLGGIAVGIIFALTVMAIIGPHVAPYDPEEIGIGPKYQAPFAGDNFLGTDRLGRDVLSRTLHGAWISLLVGVVASTAGTLVGAIMGLSSGYFGGKIDAVIQRIVDVLMSFPVLILAMALLAALDRSLNTLLVAVAVPFIPYGARVVRATTLVIKESQYVEAARSIGASDWRVILRHIAPGCLAPYMVVLTGLVGVAIITESALGFLGLGIPPPTPTWGEMLSKAVEDLFFAPVVAIVPGVFITLAVFSFSVLGDSLRDVLDPRLRGRT